MLSSPGKEKNLFNFDVGVNDDDNYDDNYNGKEACAKEADADVEVEVEGNDANVRVDVDVDVKMKTLKATTSKKQCSTCQSTLTLPASISEVKDNFTARVFEVAARKVKALQILTTWEESQDIKQKPKVQFALMCYDEMIAKPLEVSAFVSCTKRLIPKLVGERLEKIGKEIKKGAMI